MYKTFVYGCHNKKSIQIIEKLYTQCTGFSTACYLEMFWFSAELLNFITFSVNLCQRVDDSVSEYTEFA